MPASFAGRKRGALRTPLRRDEQGLMRAAALLLALLFVSACASPRPLARSEVIETALECDVAGGLVEMQELIAVGSDLRSVRAELTFERPHAHERWRPLIWLMVAERDEKDSVRIDLWQPAGWEDLAISARGIAAGEFVWHATLVEGAAAGEPHVVALDWSDSSRVEARAGGVAELVPIAFEPRRVFAGCSGMKGRLRLLDFE